LAPEQSDSLASGRALWSHIQRIPLSAAVLNLCFWCTLVLVVVAGAYVFRRRWTQPLVPVDDPWGTTTPSWIADVFLLVLMEDIWRTPAGRPIVAIGGGIPHGVTVLVTVAADLMQKVDAFLTAK